MLWWKIQYFRVINGYQIYIYMEKRSEFSVDQIMYMEAEEININQTIILIIMTPVIIYGIVKIIELSNESPYFTWK